MTIRIIHKVSSLQNYKEVPYTKMSAMTVKTPNFIESKRVYACNLFSHARVRGPVGRVRVSMWGNKGLK